MKFVETRTLHLFSSTTGFAEYTWCELTELWRYQLASEGYCKRYDLPYEFTEQERMLLAIKLSDQ